MHHTKAIYTIVSGKDAQKLVKFMCKLSLSHNSTTNIFVFEMHKN